VPGMAIRRPDPALWLYYQYCGRLPDRYRDWVLWDGTCRTWMVRVVLRGLFLVAPIVAVMIGAVVVFGGSPVLALGSIVLGLLVSIRYSLSYSVESVDARLLRHGFPAEYGSTLRRQAYEVAHAGDTDKYRAAWQRDEG
jgi:Family of unknown function (DUF5313)